MYIQNPVFTPKNRINFGQGQVNILAISDNHGKIEPLSDLWSSFSYNFKNIFPKMNNSSTKNVFIQAGDWYMNPKAKFYLTYPKKNAGDFQKEAFNILIKSMKEITPNLEIIYLPGNHDYDGGDKYLFNLVKKNDVTTVITNCNLKNSPVIQALKPEEKSRIKRYEILQVQDDKKSDLKHKILLLGLMQPGVDFYNPNLVKGIDIIDRTNKKDAKIKENDLKNTYSALNKIIFDFKKREPKGVVIVASHNGESIAKMIAKNTSSIDIIFNGHDHEDGNSIYISPKGKQTNIISLGHNSEKFDALTIHFSDAGKWDNKRDPVRVFYTKNTPRVANNPFENFFKECFKEDLKPLLHIKGPDEITVLSQQNIRKENNYLANFVTDTIFAGIKKHQPDTQIFGIASSAIRQDLRVNGKGVSNLELRNVISGQPDNVSLVYTGKVSGSKLTHIIKENIADHMQNMDRNTIVQWSGVQFNKTRIIKAIEKNKIKKAADISKFIKIKNEKGEYKPIDLNIKYKIAVPNYFFMKPKMPKLYNISERFKPVQENGKTLTLNQLFKKELADNNFKVNMPDLSDIRIIT